MMISKRTRSQEIPQVHPRDFWVAFGGIALFLLLREAYGIYIGRFPDPPSMFLIPFLGAIWITFLCGRIRGGDPLSIPYFLALAGYTLLVCNGFFTPSDDIASCCRPAGLLLTGLSLLATYAALFPRGKRRVV